MEKPYIRKVIAECNICMIQLLRSLKYEIVFCPCRIYKTKNIVPLYLISKIINSLTKEIIVDFDIHQETNQSQLLINTFQRLQLQFHVMIQVIEEVMKWKIETKQISHAKESIQSIAFPSLIIYDNDSYDFDILKKLFCNTDAFEQEFLIEKEKSHDSHFISLGPIDYISPFSFN